VRADATVVPPAAARAAFRAVFPGVMVALFLGALDQMILAAALPVLGGAFGDLAHLSWVVVAYLVAATVAAPLYGRIGDARGRRRTLQVALATFVAGSVLCAAATSLPMLIAARAVQGLGGGGLQTLSQALVGAHVPARERPRFQGYFASIYAFASTIGPLVGAVLTDHVGWRAVFLVNVPLGVLAAALTLRIPPERHAGIVRLRLDWVGAALFAASVSTVLYALTCTAHEWPPDAGLVAAGTAGAVGLVVLAAYERRVAHPLLPVRLLAMPAVRRGTLVAAGYAATFVAGTLYLPLFLQLGRGWGITASGLLLLPVTLSNAAGALIAGRLMERSGSATRYAPRGLALAAAAFWVLALGVARLPDAAVLALIAVAGLGLGAVMPAMQVVVQSAAPAAELGAATASIAIARSLGGALGAAMVGVAIFASLRHGAPDVAQSLAAVLADPSRAAPLDATARAALSAHVDRTFGPAFATIAGIAAIAASIARGIPPLHLRPVSGPPSPAT
jgi:EmrB/QacA subfamily drug resistance transporter